MNGSFHNNVLCAPVNTNELSKKETVELLSEVNGKTKKKTTLKFQAKTEAGKT